MKWLHAVSQHVSFLSSVSVSLSVVVVTFTKITSKCCIHLFYVLEIIIYSETIVFSCCHNSVSTSPCPVRLVTVQCVIYELEGQQIQWHPRVGGPPAEILWTRDGDKVVEFDGSVEKVFGSFQGRVALDRQTGRLQIFDIRLEDSGTYEYEIYLQGKWFIASYELKVMGKAEKTCFMSDLPFFFFFF